MSAQNEIVNPFNCKQIENSFVIRKNVGEVDFKKI